MLGKTIFLSCIVALAVGCTKNGERVEQKPDAEPGAETAQVMEIGCGGCIYHMEGVTGCVAAIKVDDKPMLLEGEGIDANKLMAQGFCEKPLQAEVVGRVEGDKYLASSLKVKKEE